MVGIEDIRPVAGGISIIGWLLKHWYWVLLIIFLLPPEIHAIKVAIETKNPLYPLVDSATRLFSADVNLDKNVELLRQDSAKFIGEEKPLSGAFQLIRYDIKLFWAIFNNLIANVFLLFFPFMIIYKSIVAWNNISFGRNVLKASFYFFIYLFIINTMVFFYQVSIGTNTIPMQTDSGLTYLIMLFKIMPLHGLINLVMFIGQALLR